MVSPVKAASLPFQTSAVQAGKAAKNQNDSTEGTAFSMLFDSVFAADGKEQVNESAEAFVAGEEIPAENLEMEEELALAFIANLSALTQELEDKGSAKELPQELLRQIVEQLQALSALGKNTEAGETLATEMKNILGAFKEFEDVLKQLTALVQQDGADQKAAGQQLVQKLEELEQLLKQGMNLEGKAEPQKQASSIELQASESFRQLPGSPLEGNNQMALGENAKANRSEPAQAVPTVRMANLTEELGEVLRGSFRLNGAIEGTQQIRVNITPENLGHLDIRLTLINGKMAAQIFTSSLAAKEMIELQISQLRASLLQQGVTIDKIEITQHNPQQSFGQQYASPEQRFAQQQKQSSHLLNNGYQQFEEEATVAASPNLAVNGNVKVDYTI